MFILFVKVDMYDHVSTDNGRKASGVYFYCRVLTLQIIDVILFEGRI